MNSASVKRNRWRRRGLAMMAVGGATLLLAGRPARACWWDPIVFDPQALVEHVQQVAQVVRQVQAAVEQVQNQLRELAHLDSTVAPDVPGTVGDTRAQLDSTAYGTPNPGPQFDTQFPMQMRNVNWDQYQSMQRAWTDHYRKTLIENRRTEDAVYRGMDPTRNRVNGIVAASNAATGETAALQAHNDLVAVASAEVAKLQLLKASRSRARAERLGREQSEAAYGAAERDRVRAGWAAPTPPSGSMDNAFTD